jgi:hypothetical protein
MRVSAWVAALAAIAPCVCWSMDDQPVIEDIEGDKIVVVKTPEGNRVAGRGTAIRFGDRVRTGPRASAKIRYPDGSKLLIGRATEMEVVEGRGGVQTNQVNAGEIRGIIKKPKDPTAQAGRPRFVVRSRAAVMGVRGTDFVFSLDPAAAKSQVHTLDGVVDVAKTEDLLFEGKGVSVTKDQTVSADQTRIEAPRAFDRAEYMKALEASQPEAVTLVRNDPDAVSRELNLPPEPEGPPVGRYRFLNFQVAAMYVRQKSGGEVFTNYVSFNPTLNLFWRFALRLHIGAFPLTSRTRTESKKFLGLEGGFLLATHLLYPIIVEVGPGAQTWTKGNGRTNPMGMANIAFKLSDTALFERIFAGFTMYDLKTDVPSSSLYGSTATGYNTTYNPTGELKVGVGLQF